MELKTLSDTKLLSDLEHWVRVEKESTLKVLEYLAEVDSRRLWDIKGYSSLFDFCVRHLKYSEGEVPRRIQGCRTLTKFEEVKPFLAKDELSLTNLCLLSPHLTNSNIAPLLEESKNKTTRQVEKIIESHFPESKKKPNVPILELDEELEALIEKAKLELSEKNLLSEKSESETTIPALTKVLREVCAVTNATAYNLTTSAPMPKGAVVTIAQTSDYFAKSTI